MARRQGKTRSRCRAAYPFLAQQNLIVAKSSIDRTREILSGGNEVLVRELWLEQGCEGLSAGQ